MGFLPRMRPSPSMAVAAMALLFALTGTSVAAVAVVLPRSSVGTAQLKNNAVVASKVKNNSLLRADFKADRFQLGQSDRQVLRGQQVQQEPLDPPDPPGLAQSGRSSDPMAGSQPSRAVSP